MSSSFSTFGPPYSDTRIAFIVDGSLSSGFAAAGGDAALGRRPPGVERDTGLVDVDDERCVIGRRRLAFAGFPVDLRRHDAPREWIGDEQVIDPHAEVLVEVTGAIVPPRVPPRLLPQ